MKAIRHSSPKCGLRAILPEQNLRVLLRAPFQARWTATTKRIAAAMVVLIAAASLVRPYAGPASAASPNPGIYRIQNGHTPRALCLVSRMADDFTRVSVVGCGAWSDQKWQFILDSTGYYHLKSSKGTCLIVRNFGNGQDVAVQGSCGHYADQEWAIAFISGPFFTIRRRLDGKCLSAENGDWALVYVWPCNGYDGQNWRTA